MFEHFRGDWAYAEPIFCWEVSKTFLVHFLFGPIRQDPWHFEIPIIYSQKLHFHLVFWVIFETYRMHWLSIRRNDFIACWAFEETISSHTPNEFFVYGQPAFKFWQFFTWTSKRMLSWATLGMYLYGFRIVDPACSGCSSCPPSSCSALRQIHRTLKM
jgi:hypothetical protein